MPKMRSVSSSKKRFRFTGKGKVKFKKAFHSHILTSKTTKIKRKQRKHAIMSAEDTKRVMRQLPYGG